MNYKNGIVIAAASLGLLASGCSTTSVSAKDYAQPREDVAMAQQANTANKTANKDAALHIRYAQENLERADKLIKEEKGEEAKYYLMMASSDAKVAKALAKRDGLKEDVKEIETKIKELEESSKI